MSRWNLRRKTTRRFRSSRAYKQDRKQDSNEPWERKGRLKKSMTRKIVKTKF